MGYVADQKSQIHSEFGLMTPRLKAFALALTGCEAKTQTLVRAAHHHILARASKERGHTPLLIWALAQTHRIWIARMNGEGADKTDPRLFLPRSRTNDGGASARFASRIARLGPIQRGALHLVYGERLSYDEVAEIFGVEITEVMSWLARSYAALGGDAGAQGRAPNDGAHAASRPQKAAPHIRQGRAA